MIRAQDPRDGRGFSKGMSRNMPYVTINRNIYWWQRVTVNTAIDLRENTDPGSPIKQYQVIREEPFTIELTTLIPNSSRDGARAFIHDLREGAIVQKLYFPAIDGLFKTTTGNSKYGAYVIERSNVEFNRDDFANLNITIRALGYGYEATDIGAGSDDYTTAYSENYSASLIDPDFPS